MFSSKTAELKIMFAKFKKMFYLSYIIDKRANSVDLDEVAQCEPPHLNLHCSQIQLLLFLALQVFMISQRYFFNFSMKIMFRIVIRTIWLQRVLLWLISDLSLSEGQVSIKILRTGTPKLISAIVLINAPRLVFKAINACKRPKLGPDVQSIVSLMSLLRGQHVKSFTINPLTFLLKK